MPSANVSRAQWRSQTRRKDRRRNDPTLVAIAKQFRPRRQDAAFENSHAKKRRIDVSRPVAHHHDRLLAEVASLRIAYRHRTQSPRHFHNEAIFIDVKAVNGGARLDAALSTVCDPAGLCLRPRAFSVRRRLVRSSRQYRSRIRQANHPGGYGMSAFRPNVRSMCWNSDSSGRQRPGLVRALPSLSVRPDASARTGRCGRLARPVRRRIAVEMLQELLVEAGRYVEPERMTAAVD